LRVAFQGEAGAYSETAAIALLGDSAELVPCSSFDEVFSMVEAGDCQRGVVPLENSLAGSVYRNYDLLLRYDLYFVAEYNLRISHNLIAAPGVLLDDVHRVYSHPQALAQCESSLAELANVELVPSYDTAGAVKLILDGGFRDAAAIASRRAAELYDMHVLRADFEDVAENYTRFVVLSREPITFHGESKTSIAFAGVNRPGLLYGSLRVFALRDIDLTKIESRPQKGKPWEYIFYLDFAGNLAEERCARAIDDLMEITTFLRVFGSYPRAAEEWS